MARKPKWIVRANVNGISVSSNKGSVHAPTKQHPFWGIEVNKDFYVWATGNVTVYFTRRKRNGKEERLKCHWLESSR